MCNNSKLLLGGELIHFTDVPTSIQGGYSYAKPNAEVGLTFGFANDSGSENLGAEVSSDMTTSMKFPDIIILGLSYRHVDVGIGYRF